MGCGCCEQSDPSLENRFKPFDPSNEPLREFKCRSFHRQERGFELGNRLRQLLVDDMQVLQPVTDVVDVGVAIGNAAQADQRHAEMLAGAHAGKGFHVDHVLAESRRKPCRR